MLLSEIANDSKVFIDSNLFIYHFSKFEKFAVSCLEFFQRIEARELTGFTSSLAVAEVLHRLMIIEASDKLDLLPKKILAYLKSNPEKITLLTDHLKCADSINRMGIRVLTVNLRDIEMSNDLKKEYKLFTNDAINLSVMKNNSLIHLASNDPDFERVDCITLYQPF